MGFKNHRGPPYQWYISGIINCGRYWGLIFSFFIYCFYSGGFYNSCLDIINRIYGDHRGFTSFYNIYFPSPISFSSGNRVGLIAIYPQLWFELEACVCAWEGREGTGVRLWCPEACLHLLALPQTSAPHTPPSPSWKKKKTKIITLRPSVTVYLCYGSSGDSFCVSSTYSGQSKACKLLGLWQPWRSGAKPEYERNFIWVHSLPQLPLQQKEPLLCTAVRRTSLPGELPWEDQQTCRNSPSQGKPIWEFWSSVLCLTKSLEKRNNCYFPCSLLPSHNWAPTFFETI